MTTATDRQTVDDVMAGQSVNGLHVDRSGNHFVIKIDALTLRCCGDEESCRKHVGHLLEVMLP